MAVINFYAEELICKDPEILEAHYVIGSENFFEVTWASEGAYYDVVSPPVVMELWFSIDGGTFIPYSNNPVPFNATDFEVNFNNEAELPMVEATFEIRMTTDYCPLAKSNHVTAPTPT